MALLKSIGAAILTILVINLLILGVMRGLTRLSDNACMILFASIMGILVLSGLSMLFYMAFSDDSEATNVEN